MTCQLNDAHLSAIGSVGMHVGGGAGLLHPVVIDDHLQIVRGRTWRPPAGPPRSRPHSVRHRPQRRRSCGRDPARRAPNAIPAPMATPWPSGPAGTSTPGVLRGSGGLAGGCSRRGTWAVPPPEKSRDAPAPCTAWRRRGPWRKPAGPGPPTVGWRGRCAVGESRAPSRISAAEKAPPRCPDPRPNTIRSTCARYSYARRDRSAIISGVCRTPYGYTRPMSGMSPLPGVLCGSLILIRSPEPEFPFWISRSHSV